MPDAGYTLVTSSRLQDASENLISNATATFTPLRPFKAGGVGGLVATKPVYAAVNAGVLSVNLVDTSLSNPSGAGYSLKIVDNINGACIFEFPQVLPSGATFNLDTIALPALSVSDILVSGPAGRDGYSAAPLIAMLEESGDVITTASLGGGATLGSTANTFANAGTTCYDVNAPFVNDVQIYKLMVCITGTAGQYFDLLVGTPVSGGPTVTTNRTVRIVLSQDVTDGIHPTTFIAGTDFPSVQVLTGQVLGARATSGQAQLAYSGNTGPGLSYLDAGAANWGVVSPGDLCISALQLATVKSTASFAQPAVAIAGVLESSGLATAEVDVAGGSDPTRSINSTANPTVTVWQPASPVTIATPLYKVVMPVSSGAKGAYFDLLIGSVTGTVAAVAQRVRLYLPAAVTALTSVAFYAGRDFPEIDLAAGQVFGYQAYSGQAVMGYASGSGPGFLVADTPGTTLTAYGPADICVTAYTLSSPITLTGTETTGTGGVSAWAGKRWVNFGDSYSAIFNNVWQTTVSGIIGAPLFAQYAQPGRTAVDDNAGQNFIFTEFSTQPGNTFNAAALATALTGVDLITVALGTNDAHAIEAGTFPIGNLGDTGTSFTFHGRVNDALVKLQTAAPLAKIVWIGPLHVQAIAGQTIPAGDAANWYTDATAELVITALQQECNAMGIPLIDVGHNAGFNKYNIAHPDGSSLLFRDHLHPSDLGFTTRFAPYIGHHLQLLALS